jgi:cysteine desulfurase / selenocysteine lyase
MTNRDTPPSFVSYLAYAAVAPPSNAVKRAVDQTLDRYSTLGSHAFPRLAAEREVLRESIGRLIGAIPEDIAFVPSTTRGISDIAFCLNWRPGDRILLFSGEFPANVTPWQRAAELFGLEVSFLPLDRAVRDPESFLTALEATLVRGVRLVAVSAVQFQTGLRMPLARMGRLCEKYGAELFVDAIQACGVVPLNVIELGIDYMAAGAHKWLMGIEGAGFVYVAPHRVRALKPRTAGWLSHEDPLEFLMGERGALHYDRPLKRSIQFFEGCSINSAGLAALGASVKGLLDIGIDAVFAEVSRYLAALDDGLRDRGLQSVRASDAAFQSGILSIQPPEGLAPASVARGLHQRGVMVSTPDGLIRFAPHHCNVMGEIPKVLAALDETLAELRG